MSTYNPPRYLRQGDELPDDFGTRPGDTLTFGAGSYIRAFSAEEFRQFTDQPDGIIYGRGWHAKGASMHGTVTGKIFEAHLIEVRLVPRRGSRPALHRRRRPQPA